MADYNRYAKRYGYAAKRGHAAEFAKLSEELYFIDARIKYLALFDPEGEYDAAQAERTTILDKLKMVSRPASAKCTYKDGIIVEGVL